ncbi:uncharacterized protein LOC117514921 [Thalassophryne amazonica]|uniref:uncharacterized protein LOC117514921 n=1 Tax=Thalassophryne amazonica TaxID=390379 RepID=UPI0014709CA7|nr:uncharacterized protein LOC117514921 [Thalassophryne amazonica]
MEKDCVAGLYRSLGVSIGAEFSTEDVCLLFHKVFHVPSDTNEAHMAMKTIAGGDSSWSCVGEKVLDVLLEMEMERERKEKLYWDHQVLHAGRVHPLHETDTNIVINPCRLNDTDAQSDKKCVGPLNSGCVQSCINTGSSQEELKTGKLGQQRTARAVRRLRKAARECWARLVTEGVQSMLPSTMQGPRLGVRGQAWGCVSLSHVLLLVEIKYDVVTHMLYSEMLQEHYTFNVWRSLQPWQQDDEKAALEDLAEEALESCDMLRLSELPGAFRMYRICEFPSSESCVESREKLCSAVSLLHQVRTSLQQERDALTTLSDRLDSETLKLLCLYIKLATLRAQREKTSHSAFLAGQQCFETWPHVNSPCRAEQAAYWLRAKDEEEKKEFISASPQQQAVLQLLVLMQEQERKCLLSLVHEISPENLWGPGGTLPLEGEDRSHKQTALRNGCIKRLKEIHEVMCTHRFSEQPSLLPKPESQPKIQPNAFTGNTLSVSAKFHLEEHSLLLLIHLMELQEVQHSTLLPILLDASATHLQTLQDDYKSQLQTKHFNNLLQLLIADAPFTSASLCNACSILCQKSSKDQATCQSSCIGPDECHIGVAWAVESLNNSLDESVRPRGELCVVQDEDALGEEDVCAGGCAVTEELPYLEILCVSESTRGRQDGLNVSGGSQEEEDGSPAKCTQNYEKQGSLITLAWRKLDDHSDNKAESAGGLTAQSGDTVTDIQSTAAQTQRGETAGQSCKEVQVLDPSLIQSRSTELPTTQSADQSVSLEEREITDQQDKGGQCEHETLQMEPPHVSVDSPEMKQHTDDFCFETSNDTTNDVTEVEIHHTETESEPECSSPATTCVRCSFSERETVRENTVLERDPTIELVSAVERERTMRNLVDMQKKVEQRHQRDRERQLLRVQERLTIIQNRKAEEDLLGLKHRDRTRHVTDNLPQVDKNQQKTVVRERLEQLRRERSYVMQSKRDKNTAGFKELLGPVALHSRGTDSGAE